MMERAYERQVTDEEIDEQWETMTDFDSYNLTEHRNRHLRSMAGLMPRAAAHFHSRPWGLVRFERKALTTTDDPVVLLRNPKASPHDGVGLVTALQILVPLDRRVALIIDNESNEGDNLTQPTAALARTVNQHVAINAHRAIFHHPDDRPLEGLELRDPAEKEMRISGHPSDWLMPDGWPSRKKASQLGSALGRWRTTARKASDAWLTAPGAPDGAPGRRRFTTR